MSSLQARQELSKAVSPTIMRKGGMRRQKLPWPKWYEPPIMPMGYYKTVNAADLIRHACAFTGVSTTEFRSKDRRKSFSRARHAVIYVLHRYRPDMSYPQIARAVGRSCHSTIINSCQKARSLKQKDPAFAALVAHLEGQANGAA